MSAKLLEIIAAAMLLICILDGIHKGLVMKVFSLVRAVVVLALTVVLVPILLPFIAEKSGEAGSGIAYLAAMAVSLLVVWFVSRVLKLIDRIPVVRTVNRLGGAVLGGCFGILLIWVALTVIGAFQDVTWCRDISACAKESEALCVVQRFDPMAYVLKNFDFPVLY